MSGGLWAVGCELWAVGFWALGCGLWAIGYGAYGLWAIGLGCGLWDAGCGLRTMAFVLTFRLSWSTNSAQNKVLADGHT